MLPLPSCSHAGACCAAASHWAGACSSPEAESSSPQLFKCDFISSKQAMLALINEYNSCFSASRLTASSYFFMPHEKNFSFKIKFSLSLYVVAVWRGERGGEGAEDLVLGVEEEKASFVALTALNSSDIPRAMVKPTYAHPHLIF